MARSRGWTWPAWLGAGLAGCLALAGNPASAQRTAVPLNDYTRLGQRFTVHRPLTLLWVIVPSWSDNEGGLTLILWDSAARRRRLASSAFADIRDNARIALRLRRPLPPGSYYWEVSERTGTTRVGLYADPVPGGTEDCAYLDGGPDRSLTFVFGFETGEMLRRDMAVLVRILRSDAGVQEKSEACRELAVTGGPSAVQPLAELLGDPALAHMARRALEPMPYATVDAALRSTIARLKGSLLVGVINTIGVRRDKKAVRPLASLLEASDVEVARAAAAALGRIGTPVAADTLEAALRRAPEPRRDSVAEACLECARVLGASGARQRAVEVYRRLLESSVPDHIRAAATLGWIAARGLAARDEVMRLLHSPDERLFRVALWIIARDLPGPALTQRLGSQLPRLQEDRAARLAEALGCRGDRSAASSLSRAARSGPSAVRRAAAHALARLGGTEAVASLVALARSADRETSAAASDALAEVSLMEAEAAAKALLASSDTSARLTGLQVIRSRGLIRLKPAVMGLVVRGQGAVRTAALGTIAELAGGGNLQALLGMLSLVSQDEAGALETALTAAASRTQDAGAAVELVSQAMESATAAQVPLLVRVLGVLGGSRALAAVRRVLDEGSGQVRVAALDVLAAWTTPEAVPILVELARGAPDSSESRLCLRGILRIAGNPDLPAAARLDICRVARPLIQRDDEKRALLGALADVADSGAVELVAPLLDEPSVRAEAALAIVSIAERLPPASRGDRAVTDALRRVVAMNPSAETTERARRLLGP